MPAPCEYMSPAGQTLQKTDNPKRMPRVRPFLILFALTCALIGTAAAVQPAEPVKQPVPADPMQLPPVPEGADVIVTLKSGQRLRAVFVRRDIDAVIVRIASVETRIPPSDVERIVVQRPAIERYHEMRTVIDNADVDRLLALIEWSRANRLYDEALQDLAHVQTLEPDNPEAIRLLRIVRQEKQLRAKEVQDRVPDSPAETPTVRRAERLKPGDFPLLSEEEVNLLKVWELDLNESPRLLISRDTIDKFLDRNGDDPAIPTSRDGREAFHRREPEQILAEMFRLRARDLYGEVKVLGSPGSLDQFRLQVNSTWLVNSCATTNCHGGVEAGELMLYNRDTRAERAAYTNFIIIERESLSDGRALIDYENPERSPLLHLGLPQHDAAFPHPETHGWRPAFRSMDSRRFRQAVDWIRSMRQPRTEIPIDYDPPTPPEAAETAETPPTREPQPR